MTENTMPATEVEAVAMEPERASYELAFHILPTVTEGEVPDVVNDIKKYIADAGGEIQDEEAPEHFTLAYEIEKYLEGKYRKFSSAYFGWIRFTLEPAAMSELVTEVDGHKRLLRHLCIRLTKAEEANPFRFHEALARDKAVETIDTDATDDATVSPVADTAAEAPAADATTTDADEAATMTNETPKSN